MADDYTNFYKPPTIQERERVDPDNYIVLVYQTAEHMVQMNTPYTGKKMNEQEFSIALAVNIAGIRNGLERGTATLSEDKKKILFWHPGEGEYVEYTTELQEYLLGFIGAFKQSYSPLSD